MVYENELEEIKQEFDDKLSKGINVARTNNMSLSKFKKEIKKGLTTTNDEDQWTFDYESFLCAISNGVYESPTEWGKEYYFERWSLS